MGVEVAAMPTALLSTHTGGIEGYTYLDLTDEMSKMAAHWKTLGLRFDAVYSGWLGSARQEALVEGFLDDFAGPAALRLVDPVMGDHGRLYSTYTPARVEGMARLCRKAGLITPNLTEAAFLLGEPYHAGGWTPKEARALCERLRALGPDRIVITGISTGPETVGAASLDEKDGFALHEMPRVSGVWHGTGDIFSAALLGALLNGFPLDAAAALAVDFTSGAIERTAQLGTDPRFGVDFERGLPALCDRIYKRS